jgi:DNA-binding NarL/FixJ family response regulator
MQLLKTVIIDSQKMFLQAFSALIVEMNQHNIDLIGAYSSLSEFDSKKHGDLDVIITDLNISDDFEYQYITEFSKKYNAKVLILSNNSDYKVVKKTMFQGAHAFVLKTSEYVEFIKAIDELNENRTYLGKNVYITPMAPKMRLKFENLNNGQIEKKLQLKNLLTRREREILIQIVQSKNNKEIAHELFISDQTVLAHRKNIMKKFGMNSTLNLIKYSLENELV